MSDRPLEGCVALVTGASRGIGYHCALAFARAGATVVAVGRTVGGLEELDDAARAVGPAPVLVPLDLTDFEGVDRLAPALAERFGRLDILLGNAAIPGSLTPIGHMSADVWQGTLDLNLTANWRLLRCLDPLLRAAPNGRALFMTSNAPAKTRAYMGAYSVSKAGLEALVRTYANENAHTGVTANLIDPGAVRTRLRARFLPGEDASSLPSPEAIASRIVRISEEAEDRTSAIWHDPDRTWRES